MSAFEEMCEPDCLGEWSDGAGRTAAGAPRFVVAAISGYSITARSSKGAATFYEVLDRADLYRRMIYATSQKAYAERFCELLNAGEWDEALRKLRRRESKVRSDARYRAMQS